MERRKVAIVGGGVAGLSAGCYLAMHGYDTEILEMAGKCGGVAVGWRRKGFVFDGATTWLPGSSPPLGMHAILAEIVDFGRMRIVDFDEFLTVEHGGDVFHVYTDAHRLEEEMLRLSPRDGGPIRESTSAVARASGMALPVEKDQSMYGVLDVLRDPVRFVRAGRFVSRWGGISIDDFARRFSGARLGEMFGLIFPRHGFFSVLGLIFALGWMHARCAGYPIGGSGRFVGLIEERYRALGGRIRLGARVDEILVENGRACGVRLAGGEVVGADRVVSAADGHDTIFGMLGGRFVDRVERERYEGWRLFPATIQVSLGVARTFEGVNFRMLVPIDPPIRAGSDAGMTHLMIKLSNIDPTFAPEGCTSVIVQMRTHDHAYWEKLREEDRGGYSGEKDRVLGLVIDALDRRFPGLGRDVEAVDVATPATYVRYAGTWKGSYQGWAPAPGVLGSRIPKTLPGLGRFHMAGQWVDPPGGLPRVVISGRNAAMLICREDGVAFDVRPPGRS